MQWHQAWVYGDDVTLSMPHAMPTPLQSATRHLSPPLPGTPSEIVNVASGFKANVDVDLFDGIDQVELQT